MRTVTTEAQRLKELEQHRRWRQANPDKVRKLNREFHLKRRNAVFDHYGWACSCCRTVDDLTIDHLDPVLGREHRAAGIRSARLYRWLIANGFPSGFQTLCRACNLSKRAGAHCRMHARQATP